MKRSKFGWRNDHATNADFCRNIRDPAGVARGECGIGAAPQSVSLPRRQDMVCAAAQRMAAQPAPGLLVETFAGDGIISLTAVFEGLIERVLMVELDDEIAAVWKVVVNGESEWLAGKILQFDMSKANVAATIRRDSADCRDTAFKTIIKNRTFYGGILAPGAGFIKNGKSGKGILSRWYPSTLARLWGIHRIHHRQDSATPMPSP